MALKKILFIEGEPNSPNGDLRQGFEKLLGKKIGNKMPKINLGSRKSQTINKYLTNQLGADVQLLLIDLDGPEAKKETDLKDNNLSAHQEKVYYMVQEMEAWFLSQPDVLDAFFGPDDKGKKVSDKLVKRKPAEIPDPKRVLKNATKNTRKKEYHEIKHGVELLKRLDAQKLVDAFDDFKKLIEKLLE